MWPTSSQFPLPAPGNHQYRQWNIIQPWKDGNSAICDNMMNLQGTVLSEISMTEKDKYCCHHLYVESKILNLIS